MVGTIHCPADLNAALKLKPGAVDILELRIDALLAHRRALDRSLHLIKQPLLLTVRDASEGGCAPLTTTQRLALYEQFLEHASLVDIELRSLRARPFKQLAKKIVAANKRLVCSFHDFKKTPPLSTLQDLASRAVASEAHILKIASKTESPKDLARLLSFLDQENRCPVSVMGMGALGKISRLLLARCGSVLNYGFLSKPQVSGQWPAVELKRLLQDLL